MKTVFEISDDEIRAAEWINAVDPRGGHWETVWGLDESPPPKPQRQVDILDVALQEDNLTGLIRLIDRVEQIKGRLSPRVQALRRTLVMASSSRNSAFSDEDLIIADYYRG